MAESATTEVNHEACGAGETRGVIGEASIPRSSLQRRLNCLYDHNAPRYDNDRSVSAGARFYFDTTYPTLERLLGPTPASSVHVDMPVGTGRFFRYLRSRGWRHQMLGLDISSGMVEQCRVAARDESVAVHLSLGDAFALPLADNSVDILSSLRMFHLFPPSYWPSLIAEMHRVIRPGGKLITEFRNVIRGKACELIVRDFRNRRKTHPHYFATPTQVAALFDDWSHHNIFGMGLDGLERAYRFWSPVGRTLRTLERYRPFCYLSKTLVVEARKS